MKFCIATLLTTLAPVALAQVNLTKIEGLFSALSHAGLDALVSEASNLNGTAEGTTLMTILSSNNSLTLFAPNDNAWNGIASNITGNTTLLASTLSYHVVSGNFSNVTDTSPNNTVGRTFLNDTSLVSLEGNKSQVLIWSKLSDGKTHILNQNTEVTVVSSFNYSNIFVYVVDAVIDVPGTFEEVATENNLTSLPSLLQTVPFNASNGTTTNYFAAFDSLHDIHGYTLFAPSDTALAAAQSSLANITSNTTALEAIVKNHIINGTSVYSPTLKASNGTYTSSGGESLSVHTNSTGTFVSYGNSTTARITQTDVLVDNGVIHIIDQVLYNLATDSAAASSAYASATSVAAKPTTETGQVGAPTSSSSSKSGAESLGPGVGSHHFIALVGVIAGAAMIL